MEAIFDGYALKIGGKFELNLNGGYRGKCIATTVEYLAESMYGFVRELLKGSAVRKVLIYPKSNKAYTLPFLVFEGDFEIEFCIPLWLIFKKGDVVGKIIADYDIENIEKRYTKFRTRKNLVALNVGDCYFAGRAEEEVSRLLLKLAMELKLGVPGHLVRTKEISDTLVFYAPNRDMVLRVYDGGYELYYESLIGKLKQTENLKNWLEKRIIEAVNGDLKDYGKSDDLYRIEAGNFVFKYDPERKMIWYLEGRFGDLAITSRGYEFSIENKDSRIALYTELREREFFENLGLKLWSWVKALIF